MQTIRLLIINSNHSMRQGLAFLFAAQSDFEVVGEIESADDIEHLQRIQPDVILYGLLHHDEKSISTIKTLKEVCPCTLIIVISDLTEQSHILAALAAGVDGYLTIPLMPADLVLIIKLACRSGICFFPRT